MKAILGFFIRFAPIIYILATIGFILGIRQLLHARFESREAMFGLEREIAHRHASQAISALVLAGLLVLAELVLTVFLAPNLPALLQLATPTMNALLVPTGTISPSLMETLGATTPNITPTVQATGCIPGQIDFTAPKPGDEINGKVTLTGDANIPNFGFYKYEFAPLGSDTWSTVEASRKVVINGTLGNWDTSTIAQGDYQLRLVVADNQGNELPACIIPVRINAQ